MYKSHQQSQVNEVNIFSFCKSYPIKNTMLNEFKSFTALGQVQKMSLTTLEHS